MRVPAAAGAADGSAAQWRWEAKLIDDRPPRLARVLSTHPPVRERELAALGQAEEASRS